MGFPGDQAVLEALWRAWHLDVLRYAMRRTDPMTAQDVVSDTFVIVGRKLDQMPNEPLPWLLAVARRVLANQRRAATRRDMLNVVLRRRPPVAVAAAQDREILELLEALASLPTADREVLLLSAWEGLSAAEGAVVVGCTQNAYDVRLHRARKRLRHVMDAADADVLATQPEACT